MVRYSDVFGFDSRVSYHRNGVDSKSEITKLSLVTNERLESFWDALWLGIRTFLCMIVQCLIVEITMIYKVKSQNEVRYRMNVSRASGTPCVSVFGRFRV